MKVIEYPRPGYDTIQKDIENGFHTLIGKKSEDIRAIVIVGACRGEEIPRLLNRYPKSTITAFECYPEYYNSLVKSFGNEPRVLLYNEAIQDKDQDVEFHQIDGIGCGSILKFDGSQGGKTLPYKIVETITVRGYKLSSKINPDEIDLLWIDVQGAEMKVLEGADLSKVNSIFCEVHTRPSSGDPGPYKGQCYLDQLEEYLKPTHSLHSIGLDGWDTKVYEQGNSFWVKL